MDTHSAKAQEKEELAKAYREEARELAKELLPHHWLWEHGELDARLRDPVLKSELRWERELTDIHVEALYAWTLCLVHDDGETQRAIELLDHLRQHFWPASAELLGRLLKLKLRDTDQDSAAKVAKNTYASEVFQTNPGLACTFPLSHLNFDERKRVTILVRGIELAPDEESRRDLRRQLAELYDTIAASKDKALDAATYYRRALEVDPDNAKRQSAFAAKWEEVAGGRNQTLGEPKVAAKTKPLLERALAAASRAVELEPQSADFVNQLVRLRAMCEHRTASGDRREVREQSPRALCSRAPRAGRILGNLEDVFRPPTGSEEVKARDKRLAMLSDGLFYELGVRFPSIEFRCSSDTGETNYYHILVWGIPLVGGELRKDRWFFGASPATLQGAGIAAESAINPANGNIGGWVSDSSLEKARAYADELGIHYWRPFEYVVLHLAAVFRVNALDFLRVDDVLRLLEKGYLSEESAQMRRDGSCLELTNVLRTLLADQFRVLEQHKTLPAFGEARAGGGTLTDVVERMRRHPLLRKQGSYFRWDRRFPLMRLGPNFEATIEQGLKWERAWFWPWRRRWCKSSWLRCATSSGNCRERKPTRFSSAASGCAPGSASSSSWSSRISGSSPSQKCCRRAVRWYGGCSSTRNPTRRCP